MDFISEIAKYVKEFAPKYGISIYSPIIAQAILESGMGTSYKAQYHNYFGLKYRPGRCPTANGRFVDDSKEQNADGSYKYITTEWFSFPNLKAGVQGYFDFTNIANYANLKGVTDPLIYLTNLRADGYASSLHYVQNAMEKIDKYNLRQYDDKIETPTTGTIKVAVDAGHGSNTAGKRTPDDYREHWINVNVAYMLAAALKKNGFEVVPVGWNDINSKDDPDVALTSRQKTVKAAGCDYSISCHANAVGTGWSAASGVETLIHNNAAYQGDSRRLAEKVQARLVQGTPQKNRGVKTQALAMCNCNAMGTRASILCEIGFMTNREEAELMKKAYFCQEQAEDICKGFCDYLGKDYKPLTGVVPKPIDVVPETINDTDDTGVPFTIRVTDPALNIREKPNALSRIMGVIRDKGLYTIIETSGNWGRLKSGVGWINLKYTVRKD